MVYIMQFQVDGGCRGNGRIDAVGAAACCALKVDGSPGEAWVAALPSWPPPTNQRAELTAIILALRVAISRHQKWDIRARLHVVVESDSRYAVNCMNTWLKKWRCNGWMNAAGCEVANRDVLEDALHWESELPDGTTVVYQWIPRSMNERADRHCNMELDSLQNASL